MIDEQQLGIATDAVADRFRSHGGSVEIDDVGPDGDVRVRFAGFCTGCPCRPVCLEHSVRPTLAAVPGVRSVSAAGTRLSAEAAARLTQFLSGTEARA